MKKFLSVALIFLALFSLCSCNRIMSITETSKLSDYDDIFYLLENSYRHVVGEELLFPERIEDLDVIGFTSRELTYLPLGDGREIQLYVKYNNVDFEKETNRIAELTKGSPVHGKSEYFSLPTYASLWNVDGCFEYAVINTNERTVRYVYLHQLDARDFSIPSDYIPKGYVSPSENKDAPFMIAEYSLP